MQHGITRALGGTPRARGLMMPFSGRVVVGKLFAHKGVPVADVSREAWDGGAVPAGRSAGRLLPTSNLVLWCIVAALSLLIICCVAGFAEFGRRDVLANSERELLNLSRVLAEDTDRGFQSAELVQTSIVDRIKIEGLGSAADLMRLRDDAAFLQAMRDRIETVAPLDGVSIVDADGHVVVASRKLPSVPADLAGRDYFEALSGDATLRNIIGRPVRNPEDGTWRIFLANRLTAADGGFAGVIVASMRVGFYETAYSSFDMPGTRVGLYRNDGVTLARYPHVDADFVKSHTSSPLFHRTSGQAGEGVTTLRSTLDGTLRLMAFSTGRRFPFVLTVSRDLGIVLQPWMTVCAVLFGVTAAIVVSIAATAYCLTRTIEQARAAAESEHSRRSTETALTASREIARQAGRFESALNNMLHGLAMFDGNDRLIVCNRTYMDLYDLPAELGLPGTPRTAIVADRERRFGNRILDGEHLAPMELNSEEFRHRPTTAVRELADGRTISIRSRPLEEGGWIGIHEDVTEQRRAEARLSHVARHDVSTGLPNRLLFHERMEEALSRIAQGESFAILCLDLDHFKEINDTLGHTVGDLLLQRVGARLCGLVGEADTVARIGGDEFGIVQSGIRGPESAADLAYRILGSLATPFRVEDHEIEVAVSIGIVRAPADDDVATRLLRKADIALYRAKSQGRRAYRFFEAAMDAEVQARRNLELDLRKAIDRQEFELYYQPLIETTSRTVGCFEALVRWRHPERGLVSPIDFIPLAEETGLIQRLGDWILNAACRQAAAWPAHVGVAVNISVAQFKGGSLVEKVRAALAAAGLPACRLELEITESVLLHEDDVNLATLHALRDLGVKIVMDDFGTGYSSLNYLRIFPFDKIKIDKSFVQHLDEASSRAIVLAVLQLARTLGMVTTAEGIETAEQFDEVTELGCSRAQGYWLGRPVPATGLGPFLDRQ